MTDQLGQSFRQARRELRLQLCAWTAFAIWVVAVSGWMAPAAESAEVPTALGMPSWVVWGVALPWLTAFCFTVWFATFFMKDTELVDDFSDEFIGEADAATDQESPA